MARALIGTSGWIYEDWMGRFYPAQLPDKECLDYYARFFPTVEINYSFYKLPTLENFQSWSGQVHGDFVFAVKASRFMTHMKKLKDPAEPWQRLTSRIAGLGSRLGPILLQFPLQWKKNASRLAEFLAHVTSTSGDQHQLVFEFRNESWFDREIFRLLERYCAALCVADSASFKRVDVVTAPFMYMRFHGRQIDYASNYSRDQLRKEAEKIRDWLAQGIDVYAYFNNDANAYAVKNAQMLQDLLG